MAAGLLVMSPLLLTELDHVATRELGRDAAALAADYDTDTILTLDRRDFRAVHPLGHHKAFRVLPDDLPL